MYKAEPGVPPILIWLLKYLRVLEIRRDSWGHRGLGNILDLFYQDPNESRWKKRRHSGCLVGIQSKQSPFSPHCYQPSPLYAGTCIWSPYMNKAICRNRAPHRWRCQIWGLQRLDFSYSGYLLLTLLRVRFVASVGCSLVWTILRVPHWTSAER
jgi:hypothetical protein